MFDAECDIAALVYDADQDPDAILRDFAADVNAHGYRAVGMVQTGQCADSSLSVVLLHNGETLLLAQDPDPSAQYPAAQGCKLDMTVKLACDRQALDAWWHRVSMRAPRGRESSTQAKPAEH